MSEIEALERRYMSEPVGESVSVLRNSRGTVGCDGAAAEHEGTELQDNECSSSEHAPGFVSHAVVKSDTLAGLAIRYNVSVSDIKRANGLMSESMMWSRSKLLIPTEPMPLSHEDIMKGAQLLAGYGAHIDSSRVRLRREQDNHLASAALDQLSSYYDLGEGGGHTPPPAAFKLTAAQPGEVELMERPLMPESAASAAASDSRGDDRVRLRKRADELGGASTSFSSDLGSMSVPGCPAASYSCLPTGAAPGAKILSSLKGAFADIMEQPNGVQGPPPPSRSPSGSAPSSHTNAAPSRKRESFLQKIHRAASQPALAGAQGVGSFGDAFLAKGRREPPPQQMRRNAPMGKARKAD